MELVHELFININNKKISSTFFLDYSWPFNTVNHHILLRKMRMYGFPLNICKWVEDYFMERLQYTKMGQVLSSGVPIDYGVYLGLKELIISLYSLM